MTKLIDIEAVAEMLGMKVRTIRAWVDAGKIPHTKVVGSIRFDPDKIKEWLKDQSKGVADEN